MQNYDTSLILEKRFNEWPYFFSQPLIIEKLLLQDALIFAVDLSKKYELVRIVFFFV